MYFLIATAAMPITTSFSVDLLSFKAACFNTGTLIGLQIAFFLKPARCTSAFGLKQFLSLLWKT